MTSATGRSAVAVLIDGKALAERVRAAVREQVAEFRAVHGFAPVLATILVGDDPGSRIYVANKHRACAEVGIETVDHELGGNVAGVELTALIDRLNREPGVHGTLLQLPLPAALAGDTFTALIAPEKDVDGLTPANTGALWQGRDCLVPCTPSGVIELLAEAGATIAGAEAVIVGRSNLVGRPLAALLLARDATVTLCHSRTRDLAEVCRRADILVAATGRPGLITGEMIRPGAVVIDVGINRTDDGICGDVEFVSAAAVAGAITPVPGGVGPMTIAELLRNTLKAARLQTASPG